MNALQDVREAQQMWERKSENAGRECIELNCGKRGSLSGLLGRIHGGVAESTADHGSVGVYTQKHHVTT